MQNLSTEMRPLGDIVLEVGPEKLRLRVQSHVISYSSKILVHKIRNSIRRPESVSPTSEGTSSIQTVRLEDDNAAALDIISCVLHHQPDMLPSLLPPEQILQVALLARKYEMSKALLFAQAHWLNAAQRPSFVEAGYLLAAAAAFGAGDTFKNRSTNLIADYTEPFSELKNHNAICQVLPPTIFCMMKAERSELRHELLKLMYREAGTVATCPWGFRRQAKFQLLLSYRCNPYRLDKVPICQIMEDMRHASYEDTCRNEHSEVCDKHDITMNEFTHQLDLLRLNACIDIADVNSNWAEDAGDEIIDLANDSDWGSERGITEL